jgi:ABC-type glycerol-3-phosphate transport system substrate-binding protein
VRNELIDTHLSHTFAKMPTGARDAVSVNGNAYAVPTYKDLVANVPVLYNNTWCKEYGIDMVDFIQVSDLDEMLYDMRAWRDKTDPEKADIPLMDVYNNFNRNQCTEFWVANVVTMYEGYKSLRDVNPTLRCFSCMIPLNLLLTASAFAGWSWIVFTPKIPANMIRTKLCSQTVTCSSVCH